MKTITVTFDKGSVKIETKGFTGSECTKETAALKKDLGFDGATETKTPEYFQTITETTRVKQ